MTALRGSAKPAVVLALLLASAPLPAEWPQWRGPDGLGIASEGQALPESWSPSSDNVRWRAELPGEGFSSPVVVEGQAIVTTAYRPPGQERLGLALRALAALLAAALAFLVWRWRQSDPGSVAGRERWDARVVVAATCVFLVVALVIAIRPELLLPEGNPGRTWRNAGGGALLGLATAFGWFARNSRWRLVGVVLTAVAAVGLLQGMPSGKYGSAGLEKAVPAVILGLLVALWNLIAFARARGGAAAARRSALALPILIVAALIFVPPNYMSGLSRAVVSVDLETGDLLWQTTVLRGPAEQKWPRGTFANPTPATDGEGIFAYFGHGLARLDLDGRLEWRVAFPGYAQHTRYGAGVSPVLTDGEVLLVKESELYQGGPPSWIAAFDKGSGDVRWRIEPPDAHDSYGTPLLFKAGSTRQLVTASWESLVAYDAESGEELWSIDYPMQQMVASVASWNDLLAVSGGSHGEKVLMVLRVSGEGRESRA